MRTSYGVLAALLAVLSGCGSSEDDGGSESGSGGSATGGTTTTGGTTSATGGASAAGGASATGGVSATGGTNTGSATVADHEAACRAFCEKYSTQCGKDCPETCDGFANTHGDACAALGVSFFNCLDAEQPSTFSCDAGTIELISDACSDQETDLGVCRALDGVACERRPEKDGDCNSTPATPFAFRCVSSAAPTNCAKNTTEARYCCPTE